MLCMCASISVVDCQPCAVCLRSVVRDIVCLQLSVDSRLSTVDNNLCGVSVVHNSCEVPTCFVLGLDWREQGFGRERVRRSAPQLTWA